MSNNAKPEQLALGRLLHLDVDVLLVICGDRLEPENEIIGVDLVDLVERERMHVRVHPDITLSQFDLAFVQVDLDERPVSLLLNFVDLAWDGQHLGSAGATVVDTVQHPLGEA